jgi:predicted solute-binding protein
VRLGAVSYLNVRPLVYGLNVETDLVTLRFDVPSVCAALLAQGEIDLGMVPSISYLDRPEDRVVPGVCIGSDGPVASVALFTKKPVSDVRSVAVDTSSRTSAMLLRILCSRRFHIDPEWIAHEPDLDRMLARADAALLIGDPALFARPAAGVEKIDLGATWTDLTGLPFVWAFWAGPPGPVDGQIVALLQRAAETGMAHSDEVADAYCAGAPARQALAREYLRRNLMFEFAPRAREGLEAYYREAASLGFASASGPVKYF